MYVALPATGPARHKFGGQGVVIAKHEQCTSFLHWYLVEINPETIRRVPADRARPYTMLAVNKYSIVDAQIYWVLPVVCGRNDGFAVCL